MNANQVVIVMDREEAETIPRNIQVAGLSLAEGTHTPEGYRARDKVRAALDRDPDELEARIAEVVKDRMNELIGGPGRNETPSEYDQGFARAILHALQEGTENE
jgi:hypothetical protein